ncbi:MAG TPA: hypothetical protein ENM98_05340 [Halothiobacillaceae bacterium]|nr:hypothetical protein [Halothiobacillaceae bacterium]
MMFFDDNLFTLRAGDPVGERLAKIATAQSILLMICDDCAMRRISSTSLRASTIEQGNALARKHPIRYFSVSNLPLQ